MGSPRVQPLTHSTFLPNKYRLSHSLIRAKQQFRRINLEGRNAIMADLRFNCTEKYKKQIKKQAVDKGVSVSQLLSEVVLAAIPADDEFIDYAKIFSRVCIISHCTTRHINIFILAISSKTATATAMTTIACKYMACIFQVEQSPVVLIAA